MDNLIPTTWTNIKALAEARGVPVQYVESPTQYFVFLVDGVLQRAVVLDKSPTDTTDLSDFENNYKAGANKPLIFNAQPRTTYRNITGNTTVVVKSGAGVLHSIIVGDNTTGGTITVYDNTAGSGTKIMTVEIGTPSGGLLSTSGQPGPVSVGPIGAEFSTGLTVVTTGSSSNNITVLYR